MRTDDAEQVDVLIVGAGLSGIGAGCHLRRDCPERTFAILEARDASGGTWNLFRYPGIRSDSDMQTLGYAFAPWKDEQTIADGASILRYVRQTAAEYGVEERVSFNRRVVSADYDSGDCTWTVQVQSTNGSHPPETTEMRCSFLLMCTGYYRYDEGYTPPFEGVERFAGSVIHPQHWPDDLDYAGKRVVVIGSGATAITLVPAMARTAGHVTMLQRSPSYVISLPSVDPLDKLARRLLPEMLAYQLVRWKNVALMALSYQLSRRRPRLVKAVIRRGVRSQLPEGYDVDTHFAPLYDPWDQRMCVVPDADLFKALHAGTAPIVTDGRAPARHAGIQGDDALRRAQLRADDRLHQRLMDAQGRPDGRPRLPAAQPHGRSRLPPVHARAGPAGRHPPATHRPRLRVRAALAQGTPLAGHRAALAHAPELPPRHARLPPRRPRRRRDAVLGGPPGGAPPARAGDPLSTPTRRAPTVCNHRVACDICADIRHFYRFCASRAPKPRTQHRRASRQRRGGTDGAGRGRRNAARVAGAPGRHRAHNPAAAMR
jgi:cation diffusion facilitator CzcD-associated flavoprotein CzcO